MWLEIEFLPADKDNNFLQIDSITLGLPNQVCPKHLKQQVYNTFVIFQEKGKGSSWFLLADNCQMFLQSDTVILDVCCQTCLNLPKQNVCYLSGLYSEGSKWQSWFFICR